MSAPLGELRIAGAIHEPSTPPFVRASPFERTFHRAAHPLMRVARQAANPRHTDFSGRPYMLSPLNARGTSSCPLSAWRDARDYAEGSEDGDKFFRLAIHRG